jgi:hypothetical protein
VRQSIHILLKPLAASSQRPEFETLHQEEPSKGFRCIDSAPSSGAETSESSSAIAWHRRIGLNYVEYGKFRWGKMGELLQKLQDAEKLQKQNLKSNYTS